MIPGGVNELLLRSAAAGGATAGRSVRFNSADSAYLSRTPASAGNRTTWTWSGWVKRSKLSSAQELFGASTADDDYFALRFNDADNLEVFDRPTSGNVGQLTTSAVYRDVSAWYHIVYVWDTNNGTAADRRRLYVNGARVTTFSTDSTPSSGAQSRVNAAIAHTIGRFNPNAVLYLSGYLALVHFIDGQALTPSSFGETSATTGQWIAKTYSGSYGTNGFFLDFLDNSTAAALGYDAAGSNDWTVNNLIVGPTATTNDSWSGYFDGNGDYLTLSSNASMSFGTGTFTIEGWFLTTDKSLSVGAGRTLIGNSGNSYTSQLYITTNGYITFGNTGSTFLQGSTNLADASWHHVAVSRSGTGSNQIAMWVDGTRVALGTNAENYTSGTIYIGAFDTANGYWNGYISNLRIVKGSSVYSPSSSTITVPTSPLTAITNTALLICKSSTFVDNSTNAYTVTANGNARVSRDGPFEIFSDSDSLRDHPTSAGSSTGLGGEVSGNYCTWNPLAATTSNTYANGNLDATVAQLTSARGSFAVSTGKWYWEIIPTNAAGYAQIGICGASNVAGTPQGSADGWTYYQASGDKFNNNASASYGNTYAQNDVVGVAVDLDNGKIWWSKNGTWQASGNPATGANAAFSNVTGSIVPVVSTAAAGGSHTFTANFGQRAFAYTAPSGFSPLVDTLLPTPTIAKPNTVMDALLWTGNGSARSITGLGFNPDLVWIKGRSGATDHALYDVVRGAEKRLESNNTDAEVTSDGGVTAFNSDGFSLGTLAQVNTNAATYVGWTWDAGSSNATNTSGTITSTVRANISAGFSIQTWTASGSGTPSWGHGLGIAPEFVVVKRRSSAQDWYVWHKSLTSSQYLFLNSTAAVASYTNIWGASGPSSSVISFAASAGDHVSYAWAPVAGYSAFGSYTGNGSTNGPFVYTGFRPRWVMTKTTNGVNRWNIYDATRNTYNVASSVLKPNESVAESTLVGFDFLSNGFKLRGTDSENNGSGDSYIYAAFAEAPFPYARAR